MQKIQVRTLHLNHEKPTGADALNILREEDTSVSPPLLDQGGRFTVAIPC